MKNTNFIQTSLAEKRSKLARVLKKKTHLDDEMLIKAVNKIDLSKQYSIKQVSVDTFKAEAKNSEKTIKKIDSWEEKIKTTVNILIETEQGGICVVEELHIGCLDLNKSERSYSILVY